MKKEKIVTSVLGENDEDLKERMGGWFDSQAIKMAKFTEILWHLVRYEQKW